jgi:hypothetical protein
MKGGLLFIIYYSNPCGDWEVSFFFVGLGMDDLSKLKPRGQMIATCAIII